MKTVRAAILGTIAKNNVCAMARKMLTVIQNPLKLLENKAFLLFEERGRKKGPLRLLGNHGNPLNPNVFQ